jgi:hypothetical protein
LKYRVRTCLSCFGCDGPVSLLSFLFFILMSDEN